MPLQTLLAQHSAHLPDALQSLAKAFCEQLEERLTADELTVFDHPQISSSSLKVACCSQFVSENWLRNPSMITDLVNSGDLFSTNRCDSYLSALEENPCDSEANLGKQLRLFRRREMVRIAWRDLAGWGRPAKRRPMVDWDLRCRPWPI